MRPKRAGAFCDGGQSGEGAGGVGEGGAGEGLGGGGLSHRLSPVIFFLNLMYSCVYASSVAN